MTIGAPVLLRHLPEGPLMGAEVGVLRGANAKALLQGRPELLLHLVDNWNHKGLVSESPAEIRRQARANLAAFADRVVWHEVDSVAGAYQFELRSLDFVFLDSDHECKHLGDEIAAWAPLVKPFGLLSGHDYGHPRFPGVAEAVDRCKFDNLTVEDGTWMVRVD